jgi:hypothetical protein
MMNPWFKVGHVWILCLVFSFLTGACASGAPPDKEKEIDGLAKAYRAALTEFERRAVCLDAIDAGVIARGRPVAIVDAIFGTNYARELPSGRELEAGVVDFHPLPPPSSDRVAVAYGHIGWYLAFKFDSNGTLQDYYLSNSHK